MDVFVPYTDIFGVYQRNGRDPYLDFACKMYGLSYDNLYADYKGKNGKTAKLAAKRMRQIAKPGVLGAIYRLSGGGWGRSKKGYKDHGLDCDAEEFGKKHCQCPTIYDKIKTGLWDYADKMGVEMEMSQAHTVVRMFREAYHEIPAFWKAIENAVIDVMHPDHPETVRYIGPNNCVKIDRINIEGRNPIMRMQLPSGRYLHYIDARLENCKMPWKQKNDETGEEEDVYRPALVYSGVNQETKQWESWTQTHGGKLFENLVQAIARDILACKLLEIEANDMSIVMHVHDEGVALVADDPFSPGVEEMIDIMSTPVEWAPGLLLGADGFEDKFYHK
jgi:DNA polymerase